jgi:hypothetical protein
MAIRVLAANERATLSWTGAIFLLHSLGLALLFAPLEGLVNGQPVIEQDWGLHFHHINSLEAFWRQDSALWGYNPLFMAGYPSNTIQDLSIKLFEFLALILSHLLWPPIQWFKILAFLAIAAVPWVMYFAARNLFERNEIKNVAALTAALLGTIYWWNSLPREMFFYGMVGYPPASYISVLGVSLLYRIANQLSWSAVHLGWLLIAFAVPALHVQSVVMFLPAVVGLLIMKSNLSRGNFLPWIIGAGTLSLLLNLAWLAPAFYHRRDDVSAVIVDQLPLFTSVDPLTFLKDYLGPNRYWSFRPLFWEKGLRIVLLILGSLGTLKLLRSESRNLGVIMAATLVTLFVVAYFGALIPLLKSWQPLRFKVPYDLFLALAASYFAADWMAHRSSRSPSYLLPALVICGMVSFLCNLSATESSGKMHLRTGVPAELRAIVEWIKKEAPANARVLFEESGDETGFVYDGMYLSSFVPHWTGRQLIGGPINLYNDRHHFAEFHSGKLFKREIQTFTDEEIRDYFRLYNIGAVVAFHPASIQRFQSLPGLIVLDRRIGPVHLMKVNQPLTWFFQGEGEVKAGLNRLEVSNVTGEEVILKYHWVEALAGSPPVHIVPIRLHDDPIPFIKIVRPPAAFVLGIGR